MRRAIALLLLLAFPASASGMDHLPAWKVIENKACYTFDEAKQLAEMDSKLSECSQVRTLLEEHQALQFQGQAALEAALETLKLELAGMTEYSEELFVQLDTCITNKHTAQVQAAQTGLGWYVAGGLALVLVGGVLGAWIAAE